MTRSIAGLFPDREAAEQAIIDLKNAGFDAGKIGVVLRDKDDSIAMAREQGIPSTEGAVTGGIIGGSLGAILAAVGALAIPGVGPFISGGVLVSLIGGTAGWLVGGLATLGVPEDEARYYESEVQQGRALVTVDASGRDDEARAIMLRNGAEDMHARGFAAGDSTMAGPASLPDVPEADSYADVAKTRDSQPYSSANAGATGPSPFTGDQRLDPTIEPEAVAYGILSDSPGAGVSAKQPEDLAETPQAGGPIRQPFPARNLRDRA